MIKTNRDYLARLSFLIATQMPSIERSARPLDLPFGPRVIGFGQAMRDPMSPAGSVEGMAAPSGSEAIAVPGQIGELDAGVGQHGVDLVRDGRRQFVEEGSGRHTCRLLRQPGEGLLGGPVHRQEIEFAFLGSDLGDVDVEVADRGAHEGLLGRHLGQALLSLHRGRGEHLNERLPLHVNDTGKALFDAWKHSTRLHYEDTKRRLFKPLVASRPSSGRARRLF